jgi:hypothetical protein
LPVTSADFDGGSVMLTRAVAALGHEVQQEIIEALGRHDDRDANSDPSGEHEFRMITVQGHQILFTIDYFDRKLFRDPRATSDTKDVHRTVNVMLGNGHERAFFCWGYRSTAFTWTRT